MKHFIFCIVLLFSTTLSAQNVTGTFEGNNFRWNENTNASLFYNFHTNMSGLEVPVNSNNHAIFAQLLWMGGLDTNDHLHISGDNFRCDSVGGYCSFIPGPAKLGAAADTTGNYMGTYNRFWEVTRAQVDENDAYFDCLENPNCDTETLFPEGYDIPEVFQSWPAQGNTDEGYAEYLAPFYDRNNDGQYNPNDGDHPKICGDFEVYSIANDAGVNFPSSSTEPFKIELHTIIYGYESADPALFNTLFVKRKIINRSTFDYHDVYVGLWTDFDLGNPNDDYIGTDVMRNMIFAYNGDGYDDGSDSGPGYGENPPAIGVKLLSGPLMTPTGEDDAKHYSGYETYAEQGTGFEDGIIDNERMGLSSSIYHWNSPNPVNGDPQTPEEYYNYLKGLSLDGSSFYYGIGHDPDVENGTPAHYFYPGDSDPLMAGTDGVDPQYGIPGGWTEESEDNSPGDRRMIGSTGPFSLPAGSTQFIDYVVIFAEESDNGVTDVLDTLRSYADAIVGLQCTNASQWPTGIHKIDKNMNTVSVFPNPSNGAINIHFSTILHNLQVSVYDISGRLIQRKDFANTQQVKLDITGEKGMYILRIVSDENRFSRKVVLN